MKLAALLAMLPGISGCATIMAGGPDEIPITTNPPGAYVYLDGQIVGQTPMVVSLDRGHSLGDIRIYYPGFQPVVMKKYKHLNGWVFANFFIAIFPVIIDFATGNWQRYDEETIAIGLTPGASPPPYGIQPQVPRPPPP